MILGLQSLGPKNGVTPRKSVLNSKIRVLPIKPHNITTKTLEFVLSKKNNNLKLV